jgi:PucR family transcriptional regulator, purine catabolism regulatory protein
MITVADVLDMEVFAGAQVVAGEAGLQRPISWVHNSGVPDAHNWVNGGELVLTTAFNMPKTLPEQIDVIEALARQKIAALCVTVGRYLDELPVQWHTIANSHALPLIAIPFEARFVDVARTINERIAQETMSSVRRALDINQVLSRLVLDGGGLQDLADELAGLIQQSISIETERFEALASANIAAYDEARRYTLEHGHTNPTLIQTLEDRGVMGELRETLRPVQLPQIPEVGLEMERILAPIVVHGEIYGYMWIIADGSPLSEIDWMALESGATVAALMMLHQEAVQTAEASLKGSLMAQLIEADDERETLLADQALRYGVDLDHPFTLLLVDTSDSRNGRLVRVYRAVNRLASENGWEAIVSQFAGQVVVLLGGRAKAEAAAEVILAQLEHPRVRVAVSGAHQGQAAVPEAHAQCTEVLSIMRRLDDPRRMATFASLGFLHALYHAGAASLRGNPHVGLLRDLRQEKQADLFNTLEQYLDLGGNGVATADALHIHRSTLNYRLQRITQLLQEDLADPLTRLNLQVAIKQMRMFD